jgi:hypothetical protein
MKERGRNEGGEKCSACNRNDCRERRREGGSLYLFRLGGMLVKEIIDGLGGTRADTSQFTFLDILECLSATSIVGFDEGKGWRIDDGWRMEDGWWRREGGRMEDGGWRMEEGGGRMEDGGWRMEDG